MKMTAEIKHKYYEFNEPENEYYALIGANNQGEAYADYYEDVVGKDYDEDASCKEVSSPYAWNTLINAVGSNENTSEELIKQFDQYGLLLVSSDLG
ncbi:hypothetical protein HOS78_gp143 [Lactobacillus phage Bacchae]|uniref:Uncharacterized protein n=1 Tax=Lactobacillus phage Bacchae TaxID=2079429 RepID=A0A2K9VCH1_9CAUD|nr:hypothetical protein HOS78_gp143 [Lactobacillus phage Bacchae]AUV59899.1 hypothetical protein [Lactobacillus phage Bacchae]